MDRAFKPPRVPRIVPGIGSLEIRKNDICYKHQRGNALDESADCDDQVPAIPAAAGLVGVNAPSHAEHAGNVHEIKRQMKSDYEQPKMDLPKELIRHPS